MGDERRQSWPRLIGARTPFRVTALVAACLVLSTCGTDVEWLLERDSILVAKADRIAAAAEAIEPDLTTGIYDAEDAKRAACESIYAPIVDLMTRQPSFAEELASDVGAFVAYFVPINEVERCADAQAQYQATVERLERRINDPTPADSARSAN